MCQPRSRFFSSAVGPRVERPDGLGGMLHGGIVGRNDGLRHQADHGNVHRCRGQLILQGLRQQVPDLALTGGAAHIQSLAVHHVGGALGTQQLRSHLRPIAVGDHQAISHPHQADDGLCRPAGVGQLLRNGALLPARIRELPPIATSAVFAIRIAFRYSLFAPTLCLCLLPRSTWRIPLSLQPFRSGLRTKHEKRRAKSVDVPARQAETVERRGNGTTVLRRPARKIATSPTPALLRGHLPARRGPRPSSVPA